MHTASTLRGTGLRWTRGGTPAGARADRPWLKRGHILRRRRWIFGLPLGAPSFLRMLNGAGGGGGGGGRSGCRRWRRT